MIYLRTIEAPTHRFEDTLPSGQSIVAEPGTLKGLVAVEHFTLDRAVVPSDGVVAIDIAFRSGEGVGYSFRTHAGPFDFFFPTRRVRALWPGFAADLSLQATLDNRDTVTLVVDNETTIGVRLKYFMIECALMATAASLVVGVRWSGSWNQGRVQGDESDFEGYHEIAWGSLLWRKTYREMSRYTTLQGERSVLDVVACSARGIDKLPPSPVYIA